MEKTLNTKVKAGDKFLCTKDYVMNDNSIAYKHSQIYEVINLEKDGWFNMPNELLARHVCKIDSDFLEHFQLWKDQKITDLLRKEENYDYINPNHYKGFSKETIDMMVDIWGKELVATHCEITAFKYRMRIGLKPNQPIEQDLNKSNWYLNKAKELRDNF
jgi:hypothetical protein